MVITGTEWIFAKLVAEIARHHNPYLVLKILKHSKSIVIATIILLLIAAGSGAAVMYAIQHRASKEDISEVMKVVALLEGGETENV